MNRSLGRSGQSPGGRTEYVNNVNELGYKVRLEVVLETVQGGTILMEEGIEFHVAGEL